MELAKSLFFFHLAGLCEIGGGYLMWLWIREGKGIWFAVLGWGNPGPLWYHPYESLDLRFTHIKQRRTTNHLQNYP
jgi:hypothetical protein